jgi:DNA polymerase-3 subunit epsilon
MSWLDRFRNPQPDQDTAETVRSWEALPEPSLEQRPEDGRWVVVDVETSGLNPHRDRLLSVGTVAIRAGRIELGEHLDVIVRQEIASDTDNILVHGIGPEAQRAGTASAPALLAFLAFVAKDPLVAFHAAFDNAFLARALGAHVGLSWRRPWLDLALLAPALFPEAAGGCRTLDDWLAHFGIAHPSRHNALGDAFASAQLFLVLVDRARRRGIDRRDALFARAGIRRSVPGDILNFVSG